MLKTQKQISSTQGIVFRSVDELAHAFFRVTFGPWLIIICNNIHRGHG
jgi:hypothetical protein